MRRRAVNRRRELAFLGAGWLTLGCIGQVAPSNEPDNGASGVAASPGGTPSPSPSGKSDRGATTGTAALAGGRPVVRLLSRTELRNTLQDVLGVAIPDNPDLTLGDASVSDRSDPASDYLGANDLKTLDDTMSGVAEKLVAQLQASPAPCRDSSGVPACVDTQVSTTGRRLFRRPLTAADLDRYRNLYLAEKARKDHLSALTLVTRGLLLSPNFLYRSEIGDPVAPGLARLGDFEYASALAFTFTRSGPDDALLVAAETGALHSADGVRAQMKRLLAGKRAADAMADFYTRWLTLQSFARIEKTGPFAPLFTPIVRAAALRELTETIRQQLLSSQGGFRSLLTTTMAYAADKASGQAMAALYGSPAPSAPGFYNLDSKTRGGVLTQLAFLIAASKEYDSHPMHTGALVFDRLLCQVFPPPPDNVAAIPFTPDPALSRRDNFIVRTTSGEPCRTCHVILDGVGLSFDGYDAVGRHRTQIDGFPVDESGEIKTSRDANGTFSNVPTMMQLLARSNQVSQCHVTHWLQYALGRPQGDGDEPSIQKAHDAFAARGFDVPTMLAELAVSDAFVYRRMP